MKKNMMSIFTAIVAVTAIGSIGAVNPIKAEARTEGFNIADVVWETRCVESGEVDASSIPLRIQDDVCRIYISKSWRTEEVTFEYEMLWDRYAISRLEGLTD